MAQTLVNPLEISNHPEHFTPYQVRTVGRLMQDEKLKVVNLPISEIAREKKAPLDILFYDANRKLNMWRIGQHNVLAKKVSH